MAFAYVAVATGRVTDTGTTIACTSSLNVATGDLLVCWVAWEDGASTIGISDGGSNSLTMASVATDTHNYGCLGYRLAGVANATATFTGTLGTSRGFRQLIVMQFQPDSGETVTTDGTNATAAGEGNSLLSGSINTAGADVVIVGADKHYATQTVTSMQLGGTNAAYSFANAGWESAMWARILTSPGSTLTATGSIANYTDWICHIIAFKSEAGGSGLIFQGSDAQGTQADSLGGFRTMDATLSDNLNG